MTVNINEVRKRAYHFLEQSVAACAGMQLSELQQFLAYKYWPDQDQLSALARRMGMMTEAS